MKRLLPLILCSLFFAAGLSANADALNASREKASQLHSQGNYKEAFELYRELAFNPEAEPPHIASDLPLVVDCLNRLNQTQEFDAFVEDLVTRHEDSWQILSAVGRAYMSVPHHGYIIAGEFERGGHRGGGKVARSNGSRGIAGL